MKLLPLSFPGGRHRHGPDDGPADHSGPAGRVVTAMRGGLRGPGGQRAAPLPGHVQPSAGQRHPPAGEETPPGGWEGGLARLHSRASQRAEIGSGSVPGVPTVTLAARGPAPKLVT